LTKPALLQFLQDLLQKLHGQLLAFGELGGLDKLAFCLGCKSQVDQGTKSVLASFGELHFGKFVEFTLDKYELGKWKSRHPWRLQSV
jgi:hypothetical protein